MVHESLLSMDFALPARMEFDSTAWLAAAWTLYAAAPRAESPAPGIHVNRHIKTCTNSSTHTENDAFPLMKQWARSDFTSWMSMSTTL